MKKIYMIVSLMICALLVGCSSSKKLECVHKDQNDNMSAETVQKFTFDKEGKKVKKASTKIEYTFDDKYIKFLSDNGIELKDAINIDAICKSYKTLEGSTCKNTIVDNKITIEIDIKVTDKKSFDGDYDFFKKYYEGMKYECK